MEEKSKIIGWIKRHKKELFAAGISIGALFLLILGIKHRGELCELWESLKQSISNLNFKKTDAQVSDMIAASEEVVETVASNKIINQGNPFNVSEHIRNLPEGWKPSQEKVTEAAQKGIILLSSQTLVDGYVKGEKAA